MCAWANCFPSFILVKMTSITFRQALSADFSERVRVKSYIRLLNPTQEVINLSGYLVQSLYSARSTRPIWQSSSLTICSALSQNQWLLKRSVYKLCSCQRVGAKITSPPGFVRSMPVEIGSLLLLNWF